MRRSVIPKIKKYTIFRFNKTKITDRNFDPWHDVALLDIFAYESGLNVENAFYNLVENNKPYFRYGPYEFTEYTESLWYLSCPIDGVLAYIDERYRIEEGIWKLKPHYTKFFVR